ncbi:hypothetical protein RCF19_29890 [Rhodococcus qingshengii]
MADSDRQAVLELIRETPLQLLEIQQHVAPTHQRGAEDGSSHAKPSSRPPLAIDPIDAMQAETAQIIYWSNVYGFGKGVVPYAMTPSRRGTIGQRIEFLNHADLPDWDIDNILERWMPIRNTNRKLWPTGYERTWISETEAIGVTGRKPRTLVDWRSKVDGLARNTDGGWMYHRNKLIEMVRVTDLAARERIQSIANAQVAA